MLRKRRPRDLKKIIESARPSLEAALARCRAREEAKPLAPKLPLAKPPLSPKFEPVPKPPSTGRRRGFQDLGIDNDEDDVEPHDNNSSLGLLSTSPITTTVENNDDDDDDDSWLNDYELDRWLSEVWCAEEMAKLHASKRTSKCTSKRRRLESPVRQPQVSQQFGALETFDDIQLRPLPFVAPPAFVGGVERASDLTDVKSPPTSGQSEFAFEAPDDCSDTNDTNEEEEIEEEEDANEIEEEGTVEGEQIEEEAEEEGTDEEEDAETNLPNPTIVTQSTTRRRSERIKAVVAACLARGEEPPLYHQMPPSRRSPRRGAAKAPGFYKGMA